MTVDNAISGNIPAVNPANGNRITTFQYRLPNDTSDAGSGDLDISVLRPGDITLTLFQQSASDAGSTSVATGVYNTMGTLISDAKIQSFDINLALNREVIQQLGTKFAFSREITFPVTITLGINAVLGDLTTGSLSDLINCENNYDCTINIRNPDQCVASVPRTICQYQVRGMKLVSEEFSSSIGPNKTVNLNFNAQVGSASQVFQGLFLSGVNG